MYTLYVHLQSDDPEVIGWYTAKIEEHNQKMNATHPDAGFDLPCVHDQDCCGTTKYNLGVKLAMYKNEVPSAFYLYPRSSISNTPLRLANSVGIIDSGYRGPMIACFDGTHTIKKFQRLVQVCTPTLEPMKVILVDNLDTTVRGEGGFGSTG
jgi:dUTP pyrophosphatase